MVSRLNSIYRPVFKIEAGPDCSDKLAALARQIDQAAATELQLGHMAIAERLSWFADSIRRGAWPR